MIGGIYRNVNEVRYIKMFSCSTEGINSPAYPTIRETPLNNDLGLTGCLPIGVYSFTRGGEYIARTARVRWVPSNAACWWVS